MRRLSTLFLALLLLLSAVLGMIVAFSASNMKLESYPVFTSLYPGTHEHSTIYKINRLNLFIILLEEYKIRMNTTSKMMISGILAILVVTISSGSYSITQVNAQGSGQNATQDDPCLQPPSAAQEQACQEAMQRQECKSLPTTDPQYQSKGCAELLAPK